MKTKTLLGFLFLLATVLSLTSCQDNTEIILFSGSELNNETGTCTNTVSNATLYLNGSLSMDIGIANGKGGYSAQSSDETIVTAIVKNDRLLLNAHDKKGKTKVTISDKDGNSATLPVEVSYGVASLYGRTEQISVIVDNVYWKDEELQEAVREELRSYSFLKQGNEYILQPEDVNTYLKENSKGKFTLETGSEEGKREGIYQIKIDDTLTGDFRYTFEFTYNDNNEKHTFFLNPKLKSASVKSVAPAPILFVEDITDIQPVTSVQLPENSRVIYVFYSNLMQLRPL